MSLRILVAVDGSAWSLRAVEHVLRLRDAQCLVEPHLLNVQMPLESGHVRMFIAHDAIEEYYRDEGLAALKDASAALAAAGQPCTTHIAVGHLAETIVRYAAEMGFDLIVMGTHGRGGLGRSLMGSVASGVIRNATVPVTVVKNP